MSTIDSTISGLTSAGSLSGTELVEVVQSATNKKTTVQSVKDFVSNQTLKDWAYSNSFALISATRNADNVITSANIKWPDGTSGVFTATTINSTFNTIDAWTATYDVGIVTKTITQATVTRNSSGAVIAQPEITIS